MKSLFSGLIVGSTITCLSDLLYHQKSSSNFSNGSQAWPQQLKSITTQFKQDVIPNIKEIQKTINDNQTMIMDDIQKIIATTDDLKQNLAIKK